ncbi:MAG: M14 family metallopeptidase [Kiloniellales bacterium]|nr:M14 family metallopeptidase [Kiloniellales bacterium]
MTRRSRTRQSERIPLGAGRPGTQRDLLVHRFGDPDARPKAYLQAALHADETPALLVAHHLLGLLDAADARGEIAGQVVLVPYANPVGLDQIVNRRLSGRFELSGGGNFNRNWPDIFEPLCDRVAGELGDDAAANVAMIRRAINDLMAGLSATSELERLRLSLARLAADADLVLDLHCDDDSLMHLYLLAAHWPDGKVLAAELGCRAILLADESGGGSFDESFATLWTRLAARFPGRPIPAACLASTVELRGQADVSDALAERDARALYRALQHHGLIAGEPGPPPELACEATRLEACDVLEAPAAGVLSYAVELGQSVRAGDTIAWLVDPAAEDPEDGRQAIAARSDGLVLNRRLHKYVVAGFSVAKVVGTAPLPWRSAGQLLSE